MHLKVISCNTHSFQMMLLDNVSLLFVLIVILGSVDTSCQNFGSLRLKKVEPSSTTNVYCSVTATNERFPLHQRHLPLANKVIGIYRKSAHESHICYYQALDPQMVNVNTMTGGTFYTIGQCIL